MLGPLIRIGSRMNWKTTRQTAIKTTTRTSVIRGLRHRVGAPNPLPRGRRTRPPPVRRIARLRPLSASEIFVVAIEFLFVDLNDVVELLAAVLENARDLRRNPFSLLVLLGSRLD